MRVARFYQNSFSPSSPSPSSPSPRQVSRQSSLPNVSPILFAKCLANPLSKCLTNPLRQVSRQSSSPAPDRSVHRWTSSARVGSQCAPPPLDLIRQGPIAVCTAGPQPPGRSQCAPLDLNRQGPIAVCTAGPYPPGSHRSVHRWTSTAKKNAKIYAKKYARMFAR